MTEPIITGKDLSQYIIRQHSNYFKFDPENLQQVAPGHLYKTPDKILYKFIGKKLTFAIDRHGHYSLNNVNGIILLDKEQNTESTLSILNSRFLHC